MDTFKTHYKDAYIVVRDDIMQDYDLKCFANEMDLETYYQANESPANMGAFVFESAGQIESLTSSVTYTMRGNSSGFESMGGETGRGAKDRRSAATTERHLATQLATFCSSLRSSMQ